MSPPSNADKDFLDELDDDLGEDWESAFQAEDFMFSPEDDTSSFFLIDEEHPDDNADIAALMEEASMDEKEEQGQTPDSSAEKIAPGRQLPSFLTSFFAIFQHRPLYQRGLLIFTPLLLLAIIGIFFFKDSNENQPPKLARPKLTSAPHISPAKQPAPPVAQTTQPVQAPALTKPLVSSPVLIRQKWPFHSFFIMSQDKNKDAIIINIDLSLVANLKTDEPLTPERRVFLRDAIYQFYLNRPFKDLNRYALARGEMIHHLVAWLKKQWPQANINTVIFRRYQIIKN